MDQPTKNRPTETNPITTSTAELDKLPVTFFASLKLLPLIFTVLSGQRIDVLIRFAAADVSDLKFVTECKDFLIEKATVHTNDIMLLFGLKSSGRDGDGIGL